MSRRRYISTDISTDKRINALSDFAALFYTWMIPHTDDDGTITSDPDELAWIVTPGRRRRTAQIAAAIDEMVEQRLIITNGCGKLFLPFESFYKYQSYIPPAKRRVSDPNSDNQRKSPQIAASPSPSPSPSPSKALSGKPDAAHIVFEYWKERCNHPGASLSPDRRSKIEARLREGATVERLCEAIDGCAGSKFHMGENDQGRRYDSVELIFRNAGKVDEFAELGRFKPGEKPPDLSAKRKRIANAREQLAAGAEEWLVRSMVEEDEWTEVIGRPVPG